MQLGRINSSYEEKLPKHTNKELLKSKETLFYTHNFDKRVKFFSALIQSSLFNHSSISREDLKFWFPECITNQKKETNRYISKPKSEDSIECFLAEIMEDEMG